ncbi:hypothetical protein L3X38_030531 [Prunus dulcis]|uniref:Uncharacterized protein n=1 Tax=Prunus dulcis TaxID=3755 RepID=A0AAD4YU35_PRUDU|nr:hypothetical protein L3X38_030531 [Prunus dulcis]
MPRAPRLLSAFPGFLYLYHPPPTPPSSYYNLKSPTFLNIVPRGSVTPSFQAEPTWENVWKFCKVQLRSEMKQTG